MVGQDRFVSGADRVIAFVQELTHTSGPAAGKPFMLRDWQVDIVRCIYDPIKPDGNRFARTAFMTLPRKNGKTELCAALALYHLMGDGEQGAQVYSAAADREQAGLIYQAAATMVRNDPELEAILNVVESKKRIVFYDTGSFYQAVSSESRSKHGYNASTIIYDELAQAPNRELYDVLTTSTGARAQPLTLIISTMSTDKHSIFFEQYDYACKIRDGQIVDPTFIPIIYQAPEDADAWDESVWFECNPALGDFRSLDEMRIMADRAKRMPAAEATFRNLYLNQMVDREVRYLSARDWMACKQPIDRERLKGRKCVGGLDLSSTRDLTALVLVFPDDLGESFDVLCWFWVPGDNLRERQTQDRVPYPVWRDQGFLEAPEGKAIDKTFVSHRIGELVAEFNVEALAYDRWRIEDLRKMLVDESIDVNLVEWGQGFKDMGPAVDHLETAVLNGMLRHENPILDWCASNVVISTDPAGARKINKERSREKVDGMVALAMAMGLYYRDHEPDKVAYSDGAGFLVLDI